MRTAKREALILKRKSTSRPRQLACHRGNPLDRAGSFPLAKNAKHSPFITSNVLYSHTGARAYSNAYFGGSVNKLIHLSFIKCFGFEYSLIGCTRESNNRNTNPSLEVGVKCEPGKYINWRHII